MAKYDVDFLVIGGGSGGVRAARIAAGLGARVTLIEGRELGGTCVNRGCVPKKLFKYASSYSKHFEDAEGFGWSVGEREHDWSVLTGRVRAELRRLNGIYDRILRGPGVDIIEGWGRVVGPHSVQVGERVITAEHILVSTGGQVTVPAVPGRQHVITSDDLFDLPVFPKRIVVVGGGYIGVEFACILNDLGADVVLVHRGGSILRGFDADLVGHVQAEMIKAGVTLRLECTVCQVDSVDGGLVAHVSPASEFDADADKVQIPVDQVLFATGRHPNTAGLGLKQVGVELDSRGAVVIDEHFQTSVPSIYAVGDVVDRMTLTPVALEEGMMLARNLFGGGEPSVMDYTCVPTAVFGQPVLATVGLTEAEAKFKLGRVRVYESRFRPMVHTLSGRDERTYMKLLVDPATERVVGCHMAGPHAAEIIQGLAVALKAGATKADFDRTVGIHPTAAEEFVTMRTVAREH